MAARRGMRAVAPWLRPRAQPLRSAASHRGAASSNSSSNSSSSSSSSSWNSERVPFVAATLGGLGLIPFVYYGLQHDAPDSSARPRFDEPIAELATGAPALGPISWAAVAALGQSHDQETVRRRFVTYGATILAFMGGAQWGFAAGAPVPRRALPYAVSVVPSLVGWAALNLDDQQSLAPHAVLAGGFAGVYAYDRFLVSRARAPYWYLRLRTPLTATVLACIGAAAWLTVQQLPSKPAATRTAA